MSSIVQKKAGVWKWFCWVAGLLAHFATASFFLVNKAASGLVRLLEGLIWVFGFVPFVFKYRNQRLPELEQDLYADRVQGLAILELLVHLLSVIMRSLAMLDDEDGNYPGMKLVYYYGTTGAKILNCFGLIAKPPKVKAYAAIGSVVASLLFGLGAGYVQCRSCYTTWQAAT